MGDRSVGKSTAMESPFDSPLPSRIYHYCSVSALIGIVESASIWLTSSATTNDYMEQRHLFSSVQQALERVRTKENEAAICALQSFLKQTHKDSFIASFSAEGDLLSQWRAYANDGHGVAIGFDPSCFAASKTLPSTSLNREHQVFLHEVIYGDPTSEIEKGFREQLVTLDIHNDEQIQKFVSDTGQLIAALSPLLKSDFFEDEREWRLVHYPIVLYKEADKFSMEILGGIAAMSFREIRGRLVPYFVKSFEAVKATAIRKVILGPKCEVNESTLWMLLCSLGYKEFEITRSNGSYR